MPHHMPDDDIEPRDGLNAGLFAAFGPRTLIDGDSSDVAGHHSIGETLGLRTRIVLRDGSDSFDASLKSETIQTSEKRQTVGRYQVLGEIARGGVGAVLKSRDIDLGRDVAMKVLLESHGSNPAMVQRFMEEAQVTGQLQHPGIPPVYELGLQKDTRPFFTMKLVRGRTLQSILHDRANLSGDSARLLNIFEHVCQTMAYSHSRGVVHRDLKPSNIMVGAFGEVQVLDWGLAKVLTAREDESANSAARNAGDSVIETVRSERGDHSVVGSLMGTPAYMAPEQACGHVNRIDERTDVFALGAILCEILTGKPPFVGTRSQILKLAAASDLKDARSRLRGHGADATLETLCLNCMTADRDQRPRDASFVAGEINAYLAGLAAKAQALELAAASERVRAEEDRRARRLRTALAMSVLSAILLITAVFAWNDYQSRLRSENATRLLADTLGKAQRSLGEARSAGVGANAKWEAALLSGHQVTALLASPDIDDAARESAETFTSELKDADSDRRMIDRIESTVIFGATHQDGESWMWMDDQLITAFRDYGIDVINAPPDEIARKIRESRIAVNLGYGFELWIATGADLLGRFGVQRYTQGQLEKRVEILYAADPDPYRLALRKMIFTGQVDLDKLRELVESIPFRNVAPVTLSWLAGTFGMGGDYKGQDETYQMALLTYPSDFMLNHDYAWSLTNQKRYADAIPYYRACISIRPEVAGIWRCLGIALRETGKHAESIAALEESNRRQPGHAATYVDLGISFLAADLVDEAVSALNEAVRLKPELAAAHGYLGRALLNKKQFEQAQLSLERARELGQRDTSWPMPIEEWIAECGKQLNNLPKGETAFEP